MAAVKVADVAQVPAGTSRVVIVNGQELALFNIGGEFYCIDNFCPHSGGPLGDGYLDADVVMCPWHAWQFNVKTGQMPYSPSVCVATFPCKVEGDAVLVEL
jgi:nitrite reductase/ring-hydroxylating ferredoxin subunit